MYDTVARIDSPAAANGEFPFQPEAVLPVQFHYARRGTASVEGIKSLMCAILIDAVRCFQTNLDARQPARQQQFKEAHFWIFSDVNLKRVSPELGGKSPNLIFPCGPRRACRRLLQAVRVGLLDTGVRDPGCPRPLRPRGA